MNFYYNAEKNIYFLKIKGKEITLTEIEAKEMLKKVSKEINKTPSLSF